IGRFVNPGWREQIARYASPATWQWIMVGGVAGSVLSLWLVLLHAYSGLIRHWKLASWTGGLLSAALMVVAGFSLQSYGIAAHPRAVMTWRAGELRSIPTDLDTEQETTTLAAGSLARIERSFLGWRQ